MQRKPTLENSICFAFSLKLKDPRHHNVWHPLESVLFSLLVGILCGANDIVNVGVIAEKKKRFIARYVPLPHGIPGHDTIGRVLAVLDPEAVTIAFAHFMARMTGRSADEILNIDGKTLRGVMTKLGRGKKGSNIDDQVHMVSAFSELRGYVCATMRSHSVANEVAAAQDLLRLLRIDGATVTMDAAHAVVKTLKMIAERGAHAVVTVKANANSLFGDIKTAFEMTPDVVSMEETEHAHGRIEHRRYTLVVAAGDAIHERFTTLKTFIRTERQRIFRDGKIRKPATTYYATSHHISEAERIVECVRRRWGIENKLHYVLDVSFGQDSIRVRVGDAAENLSILMQLALNLLRQTEAPGSIQSKRFSAYGDEDFLASLLVEPPASSL